MEMGVGMGNREREGIGHLGNGEWGIGERELGDREREEGLGIWGKGKGI